jgi:hypothetical protein
VRGRRYRNRCRVGQRPHQRKEPGWLHYFRRYGEHRAEDIEARRRRWAGDLSRMLADIYRPRIADLVTAENAVLKRLSR